MTIIAVVAAGYVRHVFASGRDTIMTGAAAAQHLRVVDGHHRVEHVRRVTVLANVSGLHVRWILADSIGAVMTANATTHNIHVVEVGGQPGDGAVAVVAGVAAIYVICIFSRRGDAVMTGTAVS